jgi:hypothetical protein
MGHCPADSAFTGYVFIPLLLKNTVNSEASCSRVFLLHGKDFFHKGQCQLVVGVIGRPCSFVLQGSEAVFGKGINDAPDMLMR